MANFVAVVDPDAERRRRFIERVGPDLALVDGLTTGRCETADAAVAWAADPRAPVSWTAGPAGLAVVWGDALSESTGDVLDAETLGQRWSAPAGTPSAFDGYHAAVAYRSRGPLVAGCDRLGLFPVYYYADGDVLLVGSSPEPFRHHAVFRMALDPAGLVGLLLFSQFVDGRTLLRDVRRLGAGRALVWNEGCGATEIEQYTLPISSSYHDLPLTAHVDLLDEVLARALRRQLPRNRPSALLLSGGLDSRVLAGEVAHLDLDATCLTLGLPGDLEIVCAAPIARQLGFAHRTTEVTQSPECAEIGALWEHDANGLHGPWQWGIYPHLRMLPDRVLTGLMLDSVIGGFFLSYAYQPSPPAVSFERYQEKALGWGLGVATVERLLRREVFGDAVPAILARMRTLYECEGASVAQRLWRFHLAHLARLRLGSRAWPLSFGAWPVLPILDRRLLDTVAGIPAASLGERRLEIELLCHRFPRLAEAPLDRNSPDIGPLRPRLRWQVRQAVRGRLARLGRVAPGTRRRSPERRRYFRLYDFNGAPWVAVRRAAEPYRGLAHALFDPAALDTILPRPDADIRFTDAIVDSAGLKALTGFLLWLRHHPV